MVTSQDIAEKAKVSRTLVSQVLNNTINARIKPETRARVLAAASDLGYTPNALGKALASNKVYHLGVALNIMGSSDDWSFQEIIRGISHVAESNGFHILLCPLANRTDETAGARIVELLKSRRIDGIIINKEEILSSQVTIILREKLPMVLINCAHKLNIYGVGCINSVGFDIGEAFYLAFKRLVELGHRRIALFNTEHRTFKSDQHRWSDVERLDCYRGIHDEFNLPFDEDLVPAGDFSQMAAIEKALDFLLKLPMPPTAAVTANCLIAAEIMRLARQRKMNLPDDLSIISGGEALLGSYLVPSLSTIAMPYYQMGIVAANKLIAKINKVEESSSIDALPANFIERESIRKI